MKVLIDDFYEVVLALEDVSGTVCWPVREWCIKRLRECSALLVESVLRLLGCVSCTSLLSS